MPWDELHYPLAMRNLPDLVRAKAIEIEIANALLEAGYDEGRAIRIAIVKAREWARGRGLIEAGAAFDGGRDRGGSSWAGQ